MTSSEGCAVSEKQVVSGRMRDNHPELTGLR